MLKGICKCNYETQCDTAEEEGAAAEQQQHLWWSVIIITHIVIKGSMPATCCTACKNATYIFSTRGGIELHRRTVWIAVVTKINVSPGMLLVCGGLVNGPYSLITTAVSADLVSVFNSNSLLNSYMIINSIWKKTLSHSSLPLSSAL